MQRKVNTLYIFIKKGRHYNQGVGYYVVCHAPPWKKSSLLKEGWKYAGKICHYNPESTKIMPRI